MSVPGPDLIRIMPVTGSGSDSEDVLCTRDLILFLILILIPFLIWDPDIFHSGSEHTPKMVIISEFGSGYVST